LRDKLVAIPLLVLLIISMFSLFIGTGELGNGYTFAPNNPEGYPYVYDWTGYPIAYFGNFTKYNEADEYPTWQYYVNVDDTDNIPDNVEYMLWSNSSFWTWEKIGYYAYYTPDGNASATAYIPMTSDNYRTFKDTYIQSGMTVTGDYNTTYGLIILAISMLVIAGIIGFNFVNTGENEKSTQYIITTISLLSIWGVFSIIALFWLSQFPYGLGAIGYFGLTAIYCLGIFMKGTE
jgi:hypothetical protein